MAEYRIGCAGWSLPQELRKEKVSYLERYGQLYNCVEINSSFYQSHEADTYRRWAESVPATFQFSVKAPKSVSHAEVFSPETATKFLSEVSQLGPKLGPIVIQLPPKRAWDKKNDTALFKFLRNATGGVLVCEPRHASWFTDAALELMDEYAIGLVGADPKPVSQAPDILRDEALFYLRLHGTPQMYYSEYPSDFIKKLSTLPSPPETPLWVIFDNTALGHAYRNARDLAKLIADIVPSS